MTSPCAIADQRGDAVLAEINFARANPDQYALELSRAPDWLLEQEEPEAVAEAIAFLRRQPPLPPLQANPRLDVAAAAHVRIQSASGEVGHGAAGALGVRLRAAGLYAGISAENISYGHDDARAVVRQLIIDSRVPGRGHRRNIFSAVYTAAGVACGPHRRWGAMCVIDFAGAIMDRGRAE